MSGQSAKYGQQKKRQAIRQIQQRSKRLASSQRNPFTWTRDSDNDNVDTSNNTNSVVENDVFDPPSKVQPVQPKHNPFMSETTIMANEASPKNIFAESGSVVSDSLFQAATATQPSQPEVLFAPEPTRRLSRQLSTGNGKRNPATKAHNAQQLKEVSQQKLSDVLKTDKNQRNVGVCSFMCSLKEYNQRLDQDIYSTFETANGTFEHHLAVKEYKRASADQEESHSDDLRPSIILLKTAQYLCMELLETNGNNFEDIYDFMWNRMRAIRKDVTQQRLCDIRTVSVLETITRFHILSAYVMSGSTNGNFEQKYNNENLEKTLTSLRHLYTDMSLTADICCNEPEFRMYHILLNLNSGQVMHDVFKLQPAILNSEYVRYALCCYNAYNTKNFVRFFRLFHSGTLLASCILYRYINNIRQKALVSIINSHTLPAKLKQTGTSSDYPISKLQVMLGCDSTNDTIEFLNVMGVEVNSKMEFAVLRNRQYEVNNNKMTGRLNCIDIKISLPLGKIMFTGEYIPDSILGVPVPVSPMAPKNFVPKSFQAPVRFDPPGMEQILEKTASSLIAQVSLTEVDDIITESLQTLQLLEQAKIFIIKELLDEICHRSLKEELVNIKNDVRKEVMIHTKELYKEVFPTLLNEQLFDVIIETLLEAAGLGFVQEWQSDLLETVIFSELNSILHADAAYLSRFENLVDHACNKTYHDWLNTIVVGQLHSCISEANAELLLEKKANLKQLLGENDIQKRYYFKVWKKRYSKIYAKRHTLDSIPPRIASSSSADVLRSLLGTNKIQNGDKSRLALSEIAHIDLTSPTKTFQKKIEVHKKLKLRMNLLDEALSIKGIPLKCFAEFGKPLYITLAIDDFTSKLSRFILDSFGISETIIEQDYVSKAVVIGRTVLKLQLVNLSAASHQTLIDSCKSCHVIVLQSVLVKHSTKIDRIAQSFYTPKILISVEKPTNWTGYFVNNPVSMTNMRCCNLYKSLNSAVHQALQIEKLFPAFKMVDVRDLIQTVVCMKLTDILLSKQVVLNDCKLYSVNPNLIISFYNSIIRYLAQAVSKEELKRIDWPSLFDKREDISVNWNDSSKMTSLSSEIQSLCLPSFNGEPDSAKDCLEYCSTLKVFSTQFLISRITCILEQAGIQWCLVLNQIIHHLIENVIFVNSYTVLLECQLNELNSLNGEKIVEDALVHNELEAELAEYDSDSLTFIEEDISEMWQSLSFYESKLLTSKTKPKPTEAASSYFDKESKRVDVFNHDLQKLSVNMSETESRLQSIVDDGALPSYLMKSLLDKKIL